jgi:hypothetical protein
MMNAMTRHSDAEQLAAFVDGQLDHEQLQEVTAHLATCEECRSMIGEAVAFEREEQARRTPWRGWWAVAAAVVVIAGGGWYPFERFYLYPREIRTDQQALYTAQKDSRALAGRYADEPYHGKYSRMRGGRDNPPEPENDKDIAVMGATAKLREDTADDSSTVALRARAMAEAIDKEPAVALQTISKIPERARDAGTWNDIAVIALAANKPTEALAAVNRALQLQPKMPEALFTRWEILQTTKAAQDYLDVDPNSQWANEIREKTLDLQ